MHTRVWTWAAFLAVVAALVLGGVALADEQGEVEFAGVVTKLPDSGLMGDWKVNDITVHVTEATTIDQDDGAVAVGSLVKVKGVRAGANTVDARRIEVQRPPVSGIELMGFVLQLPEGGLVGDWKVNDVTVHVTADTTIDQTQGRVAVGALVKVRGTHAEDRTVNATRIEVVATPGSRGELVGIVRALPEGGLIGVWTVNMTTVHVTDRTEIDQERGRVVVGAIVRAKGERQADGSLNAMDIEVIVSPARGSLVKFYGVVQALPSARIKSATKATLAGSLVGDWKVGDVVVHVSADTEIDEEHGAVAVGALVEVSGVRRPDGSVDARRIEVKMPRPSSETPVAFPGVVDRLPESGLVGEWLVSGRRVQVTEATQIDQEHGAAAVGAYVQVKGVLGTDGVVRARQIEVKGRPEVGGGVFVRFRGVVDAVTTPQDGKYDVRVKVSDTDYRIVHAGPRTQVDTEQGALEVGKTVAVKGIRQADASVDATSIEVVAAP